MTEPTTTNATTPADLTKVNAMLDRVIAELRLKNDAALARALGVAAAVISKTRSGILPFGLHIMVRIYDAAGIDLRDIRAAVGLPPMVKAYVAV